MKRTTVFGVMLVFLLVMQTQMVFADANEDFDKALSKNNLKGAEDILRKRADKMNLDQRLQRVILDNVKGFNPSNAISIAETLVRYGANVNAVRRVNVGNDRYYEAPLLYITVRHSGLNKEQTVQMINLLCRSGANPNARIVEVGARHTALMYTTQYKTEYALAYSKALIESGANVNLQDDDGNTALMWAWGDFELFKYFVDNKADLNIRNNKGETALILAAENEKTDVLKHLVERGANINLRDNNGMTAASICYDKGQIDLYNYLKQRGAIDFEPRQVTQRPAAQTPAPAPAAPPPAQPAPAQPNRNIGREIAEAFSSPIDNGTYSVVGTNMKMRFTSIGKSGMATYTNREGRTSTAMYSIDGNRMTLQMGGYTFQYTITSRTSFTGHGENWVRTGF